MTGRTCTLRTPMHGSARPHALVEDVALYHTLSRIHTG
jgi:hypothetical protein